jgi:hypothetical protein
MINRIVWLLIIGAAGYWYWTGPYQQGSGGTYEDKLKVNAENMELCTRGESYRAGATGEANGDPEENCAQRYNLYQDKGKWHSYDDVRPEGY